MSIRLIILSVAFLVGLLLTSCDENDEVAKPIITILQLGDCSNDANSHTALVGHFLHMKVDIEAEGKVDYVQIRINHDEAIPGAWEVDSVVSGFGVNGLKVLAFHKHIDIDTTAELGVYYFEFVVVDMAGNQSSAEAKIELAEE